MSDVSDLAAELEGVRRSASGELCQWRLLGRVVARELDDTHVVIRADLDYRDAVLRQFPVTFNVPSRFRKHTTVVADLANADPGAIEDARVAPIRFRIVWWPVSGLPAQFLVIWEE